MRSEYRQLYLTDKTGSCIVESMENSYARLIEQEQAKIALLKAKIAECERRIQALQSFLDVDELDNFLAKSLSPSNQEKDKAPVVAALEQAVLQTTETAQALQVAGTNPSSYAGNAFSAHDSSENPKRRLTEDVQKILWFIGPEGKSLDVLEKYCTDNGFSYTRATIRSLMSSYKLKHRFIDSPEQGFFRLTERALTFLSANYPSVALQSETPSVGAEGVSDTSSTEATVEGGPESDGLL